VNYKPLDPQKAVSWLFQFITAGMINYCSDVSMDFSIKAERFKNGRALPDVKTGDYSH